MADLLHPRCTLRVIGDEPLAIPETWNLQGVRENGASRDRTGDLLLATRNATPIEWHVDAAYSKIGRRDTSDQIRAKGPLARLLEQKQAILEDEHAAPRCHRIAVPADLADDDWPQALTTAGFDNAGPAVLIAEDLSWYLTEDENARLLDAFTSMAAPGSRLGSTS